MMPMPVFNVTLGWSPSVLILPANFVVNDRINPGNYPKRPEIMPNKFLDLMVNNPPETLFHPIAQMLVAGGVFVFFLLWGVAKLIKVIRGTK